MNKNQLRAFVLTDLGYGDAGKGTTTHWLTNEFDAHTIIRTGGCQAMHNVVTARGRSYCFTQFGSGTLDGTETILSQHMVADPYAILSEGDELSAEFGITNIFDRITIHEDTLLITPYHAIANRLEEYTRGANRNGSVGIGVGNTVVFTQRHPHLGVYARDLNSRTLRDTLHAIRKQTLLELQPVLEAIYDTQEQLPFGIHQDLKSLMNPQVVDWTVTTFGQLYQLVRTIDSRYIYDVITAGGTVVFEPSQGVLLDRWYGFHPHKTQLVTTSQDALSLLKELHYPGQVVRLGITRTYQTRHGAGPFVTEDDQLTKLVPDEHNREHPWQQSWRVGYADALATQYAIKAAGGVENFDGFVVTCVDRLAEMPKWQIATSYLDTLTGESHNCIPVRPSTFDDEQIAHQTGLTALMKRSEPRYVEVGTPTTSTTDEYLEAFSLLAGLSPVLVTSHGQTELDKDGSNLRKYLA